jgi:hypothetical protein
VRSLTISLTLLLLAVALMLGASFYLRASCGDLLHALPSDATSLTEDMLSAEIAHWEARIPVYSIIAPRSSIRRVRELMLTLQSYQARGWDDATQITLTQLRDTVEQLRKDTLMIVPL